jgi:hypothetical protein
VIQQRLQRISSQIESLDIGSSAIVGQAYIKPKEASVPTGIHKVVATHVMSKAADPLRATRAARRYTDPLRAQYDYSCKLVDEVKCK